MRLLDRLAIRSFLPMLLAAMAFFVLILHLVDLFDNIVAFLNRDVPMSQVAYLQYLYLPQTIRFALPVALLFSASFTLGTFYGNNELIAVFGAGVPFVRFVMPIVLFGVAASAFIFWFEDAVVIDATSEKNAMERQLLGRGVTGRSDLTVTAAEGRVVFYVEYFVQSDHSLDRVTVFERDESGRFVRRVNARTGEWVGDRWELRDALVFEATPSGEIVARREDVFSDERYRVQPHVFARRTQNVDELRRAEAREFVESRREAGLPYRQAMTDYLSRYSFAFTPLVVTLISCAVGSRLKKNILLFSLLTALGISVLHYVLEMVTGLLARFGYITPHVGAFSSVAVFLSIGVALLSRTRS